MLQWRYAMKRVVRCRRKVSIHAAAGGRPRVRMVRNRKSSMALLSELVRVAFSQHRNPYCAPWANGSMPVMGFAGNFDVRRRAGCQSPVSVLSATSLRPQSLPVDSV
jgi:hypothetical protein